MVKNIQIAWSLTILSIVVSSLIYIFKIGGTHFVLLTDYLSILFSITAIIIGIKAITIFKIKNLHGKSLLFILIGIFLWSLAEIFFLLFLSLTKNNIILFGTNIHILLDTLRFIGYIPIIIGLVYILKVSDPKFRENNKNLIKVGIGFLICTISYLSIVPIILRKKALLDVFVTNGFIIADFILLFGVFLLIKISILYKGGQLGKAWIIFALAFTSIFLFDLYYSMNYTNYYFGHISELFWLLSYILIALGFYYNCHIIEKLHELTKK